MEYWLYVRMQRKQEFHMQGNEEEIPMLKLVSGLLGVFC